MTLNCDLGIKFAQPSQRLCTLSERNIWVKFNQNRPMGSVNMERTQKSRVNPLTLTCPWP